MQNENRAKISIGNKDYFIDELNDDAKAQVQNILYVNSKIKDLQSEVAVLNAAREYYTTLLASFLPKEEESDKISFSE